MIQSWLQRLLEATGRVNTDGVSRRARATFCRSCGAGILLGLDAPMAGVAVAVDPTPISALGEALALLDSRTTYSLHWSDHYELHRRDQYSIAAKPAGTNAYDILAEHKCGSAPLPIAQYPIYAGPTTREQLPEEAPF